MLSNALFAGLVFTMTSSGSAVTIIPEFQQNDGHIGIVQVIMNFEPRTL